MKNSRHPLDTIAAHAGLDPDRNHGIINPPVYHTSTILKQTLDDYRNNRGEYDYGRIGTPTSVAVEKAVAELYKADDVAAVPSGLAAITMAIMAVAKADDHLLFPDSIYGSGRRFIEQTLPQYGIKAEFYDPLITEGGLRERIRPETRLVYIETPGSLTFELQDTAAIVKVAKDSECLLACDNTWGTAMYFDAFGHGIDLIIEAGTKYIAGHSDVSIGFIASNGKIAKTVRSYLNNMGVCVGPDDLYMAARGLRTYPVRLRKSEENGLALARWIETQPEVIQMLHPALPSHPQHQFWKRDFTGSCGLFGFVLRADIPDAAVDAMVDDLRYFGIGASWGGYESLISEAEGKLKRSVSDKPQGRILRIYAGIEDTADLMDDIQKGFARMQALA
jgi:cystathionine beta-lyase